MSAILLPEAREQLEALIAKAGAGEHVFIESGDLKAVLVSLKDYYEGMDTATYLMGNPGNKKMITKAIEQMERGEGVEREIDLDA